MAQADNTLQMSGTEFGSLQTCQRCGGVLELQDGTDPDDCDEFGGFEEEYKCSSCERTGTYTYRYRDGKRAYTGVCADYQ